MNICSRMDPLNKMTLSQDWITGRLDKYLI